MLSIPLVFYPLKRYNDLMISCIVLSAGLSERFGSPKALAQFRESSVLTRLQNMLVSTQVDEIIIVLGACADTIKPQLLNHTKIKFVYNKNYIFGQTSSFKAGLGMVSQASDAVFLLPVDYPVIDPLTVNTLIAYYLERRPPVLIPSFQEKKGHPPLFSIKLKEEFLGLKNDIGINSVAHAHQDQTTVLPVEDPGVVMSFNTQDELESIIRSEG